MSSNSLLPPNATAQEVALAETVARISDVPVLVRQSRDPASCPVQLLPWLAWAYSVDEWDPNWTEAEKRGVIAQSLYVHQHKGTIGAIERAFAPLGYNLNVIEWFEETPAAAPYTFRVELGSSGRVVDDDLYLKAERLVRATKNERSQLTGIRIASEVSGKLYMGSTTLSGEEVEVYPYTAPSLTSSGKLYYAAACVIVETVDVWPQN